ncbi:IPT/TIG domain-containing protein [Chloroflexota bacterium]
MKQVTKGKKYVKTLRIIAVAVPLLIVLIASPPAMAAPIIDLSTTAGTVGTTVTINGNNFDSYRGDNISLYFNNQELPGSPLNVPDSGTFSFDFNVPDDAEPGSHTIRVRSEIGSTLTSSPFTIPQTDIMLDVREGAVGTAVTIQGQGFHAKRLVSIFYYAPISDKLSTEVADAIGEFTYRFTVPASTAGKHRIVVNNAEGDSAEAEFEVVPTINLNINSGAPGDILTVSGNGFGYRSDISIFFGNTEAAYAKASEYGSFVATFNIPELKGGNYDVKAIDEDENLDWDKFIVTAGAIINQATGSVGTKLTVKGTGFKPHEAVIIKYEDLQVASTISGNDGGFSSVFYAPASESGQHLITVSDGTNTRVILFAMEATAPPAPTPLLPANAAPTKSRAYLDWSDVTDPSLPVSYQLQIATDMNFATVIADKETLTESQYTLPEEERLQAVKQNTTYFWRVKAVDSASNESEWSEPWYFYVAAPPTPTLLLPEADTKAEAMAFFDWEDVTSLSLPMSYRLQIATDASFKSIIMETEDLAVSEYTLTEEEKLPAVKKEAPYYWRVQAVDSDGNQSMWVEPRFFYVGFSFALPGWALYTLIGVAILIIGMFAFWIGRRTAYYQEQFE